MRIKPSVTRYYKNMKTGQYCELSGYIGAVKAIEKREWKRQKVVTTRVSKREHDKNRHPIGEVVRSIGLSFPFHPGETRKHLRLAKHNIMKRNSMYLHKVYFSYDGICG